MPTATLERKASAEDLDAMGDPTLYELVDGALVERQMSLFSSRSGARATHRITAFAEDNELGYVLDPEIGIRIHPTDPDHTRRPDVAFITWERAPLEEGGFLRVPPELVVEIVSPGDGAEDVQAKVTEWLDHGVELVWVVFPSAGLVQVHQRGKRAVLLSGDDEIDGAGILPGFRTPIASLMPSKPPARLADQSPADLKESVSS